MLFGTRLSLSRYTMMIQNRILIHKSLLSHFFFIKSIQINIQDTFQMYYNNHIYQAQTNVEQGTGKEMKVEEKITFPSVFCIHSTYHSPRLSFSFFGKLCISKAGRQASKQMQTQYKIKLNYQKSTKIIAVVMFYEFLISFSTE